MSPQLYTFKVAFKYNRRIWRRIEILEDHVLRKFDQIIRRSFNHDEDDHLSEFYQGKASGSTACGVSSNPMAKELVAKRQSNSRVYQKETR